MSTHEHSLKAYYFVYLILMVGLVATVWVAYHDFGIFATPVALSIATIKAAFVIWIFMHVKDASHVIWLTIAASLVVLAIGAVLIFGDYFAR